MNMLEQDAISLVHEEKPGSAFKESLAKPSRVTPLDGRVPDTRFSSISTNAEPIRPPLQKSLSSWQSFVNLLRIADLSAIFSAILIGHYLRFSELLPSQPSEYLLLYSGTIIIVGSLHLARGYRVKTLASLSSSLSTLFMGGVGGLLTIFLIGFLSGTISGYSRYWFVATAIIASIALTLNRIFFSLSVRKATTSGYLREKVVIVGANEVADKMISTILKPNSHAIDLVGLFEDRVNRLSISVKNVPLLGTTDDLLAYVRQNRVDRIIVTLPWLNSERINAVLKKLRTVPARIDLVPHDVVWQFPITAMERLAGIPVLTIANGKIDEQIGLIKRAEDIFISSVLLTIMSPVLALIAAAIKLDSKGPVIFKQKRHGFNNEIFEVYKFRSMKESASISGDVAQATKDDPRVTRVGKWLRKTSLDELPQLLNVLMGSMSIVGPRPHAVQHNHEYAEIITEYFARHNVKPGITGWAQVNGLRGETDTDEKMRRRVEFDLHYIEHWSLFLDFKIIIMTAVAVWFHETAY